MIVLAFYIHGLRYVRKFNPHTERRQAWDEGEYWLKAGLQVHIREE